MSMNLNIPKRNILDLRSRSEVQDDGASKEAPVRRKNNRTDQKKSVSFLTTDAPFRKPRKTRFSFYSPKKAKKPDSTAKKSTSEPPKKAQKPKKPRVRKVYFSLSPKKLIGFAAGAFVIAAFVFALQAYSQASETKGEVLGATTEGFTSLQQAKEALLANDQKSAQESLSTAVERFSYAQKQMDLVHKQFGLLVSLPGMKNSFATGEHAIAAGNDVARLGTLIQELAANASSDSSGGYVAFMESYQRLGPQIRSTLDDLSSHLEYIDVKRLPKNYQNEFITLEDTFSSLNDVFARLDKDFTVLYSVLGFNGSKEYLLIFQNNQELRPTGGFIGSVARVEFRKGKISQLTVPKGGSYDISGQVKETYKAPRPLQIVNPYLSFQDANWFPDFPTSAKKILELYYNAGNSRVDGVITFTPDVLLSLLDLTGPIDLQDTSQVTISADNFLRVTRKSIEQQKREQSTEPKKIIADMMPKLLEATLNLPPEKQFQFISLLDESIQQQNILMYAEDPAVEQEIDAAHIDGALPQHATDDYLSLITSNIAGGKTDRVINQHIYISTELTPETVADTLQIIRQHTGLASDEFTGTTNLSYMRAYIPLGAQLTNATGFYDVPATWYQEPPKDTPVDNDLQEAEDNTIIHEKTGTRILDEFNHTVFGNWMRVEPQASTRATFSYNYPRHTNDDVWTIQIAHQPGQQNVSFTWHIRADREIDRIVAPVAVSSQISGNQAEVSFDLTQDTLLGVVFK